MNLEDWRSKCRLLPFGRHQILVRDVGSGAPVVFLHGFPTSSYDFAEVIDRLGPSCRCVAFDFLGFGGSSRPFPHEYGYDEQVAITLQVIREAKLARVFLVAHDYGVSVAQEILARAARKELDFDVQGVVFLNGGLSGRLHHPLLVQRLLASRLGAHLGRVLITRRAFDRSMSRVLGSRFVSASFLDEAWNEISIHDGQRVAPLLLRYMRERRVRGERWEAALRASPVPLTFVWGMTDPVSGRHMLDWVAREIPNGKRVPLYAVGHYPQVEAPEAVTTAIRGALGSPSA